jgi:hypothetical protein
LEHYDRGFQNGHRVPQPGRHHAGLELPRPELLSRREEAPVVQAVRALRLRPIRARRDPGRATSSSSCPACACTSPGRASSASTGCSGRSRGRQRTFKPAQHPRVRPGAVHALAQHLRPARAGTLDLLRPGRPVPRPLSLVPHRGGPAAERAVQPVGDLRPRGVRPPDRQLPRSTP